MAKRIKSQHDLISGARDLIGSNEDLLRMILFHIPYKSLNRFKSVSKLWLSVISDPDFQLRWNTMHAGSTSALLIRRSSSYEFISLEGQRTNFFGPNFDFGSDSVPLFNHSGRRIQVLHSCNGLLLVRLKVKLNFVSYEVRIGLYNPRTNQLKLVPKFPRRYSNLTNYTKLAFDPSKSPHYKLVSIVVVHYHRNEILTYSSETDSWKVLFRCQVNMDHTCDLIFKAGVYLNGAIHWPNKRGSSSFYFDVDVECCVKMRMPPLQGGQRKRTIRHFGESGGHLHLIDYEDDFTLQFDVFEMENDYSNWFVKYRVDLATLGLNEYHVDLNPLSWFSVKRFIVLGLFVQSGDTVKIEEESPTLIMYVPADKMVICYSLNDGESKELCPLSLNCEDIDSMNIENWSMVHQITY